MKKIIQYILLVTFIVTPLILNAQTTSGTCTGELRTDLGAAQVCANLAEQQGAARGYTIDCKVEQLGLAGFVDPTSGKDYILNTVCSVNGSKYEYGAYLLAGFTASSDSNAVIKSVSPGWNILATELVYDNAFSQCGGKAPYYVNGAYTCTIPQGALPTTPPVTGTTRITTTNGSQVATQMQQAMFTSIQSAVQNLLRNFSAYTQNTLGFSLTNTGASGGVSPQCFEFTQNLSYGDTGSDVRALTYALKQEDFLPDMTSNFDTSVMVAVKRFQEFHSTEILSILGLTQGTGVVGEKTRNYLNTQCSVPSYIITNSTSSGTGSPTLIPTPISTPNPNTNTCTNSMSVSGKKTGVYTYTFTKNTDGTYKVQLNNPAYRTTSDPYYVPANFSFTAPNALDLNRQNQGKFNYLQSLPGTAEGNTEYANLFGSFNNAYYDWSTMTASLSVSCANPPSTTTNIPILTTPLAPLAPNTPVTAVRYIKISVADWDTLPLALREVVVISRKGTLVKPVAITATDYDVFSNTPPSNLIDGNENSIWKATKSIATCSNRVSVDSTAGRGSDGTVRGQIQCSETDGDLQVITLDLGQAIELDQVRIVNYGFTDTRVFVIEVGSDDRAYSQIAEVRAQLSAPIVDRGVVYGIMEAATTIGPVWYPVR